MVSRKQPIIAPTFANCEPSLPCLPCALPRSKVVLIPTPTWANHRFIFEKCGLEVRQYRCAMHGVHCIEVCLWCVRGHNAEVLVVISRQVAAAADSLRRGCIND